MFNSYLNVSINLQIYNRIQNYFHFAFSKIWQLHLMHIMYKGNNFCLRMSNILAAQMQSYILRWDLFSCIAHPLYTIHFIRTFEGLRSNKWKYLRDPLLKYHFISLFILIDLKVTYISLKFLNLCLFTFVYNPCLLSPHIKSFDHPLMLKSI